MKAYWRPIKTAPRPHVDVLVYGEDTFYPHIKIAFYDPCTRKWTLSTAGCGAESDDAGSPTHWSPLPEVPDK